MSGRASGVLLHVSSLPGRWGVGTLGAPARRFADFLESAGQRWWQILPLTPADEYGSPYSAPSAFAGNTLLIDPEGLRDMGLLTEEECRWAAFDTPDRADFGEARRRLAPCLRAAFRHSGAFKAELDTFARENGDWLPDYALFTALTERLGVPLSGFPADVRAREPEAMARWTRELAEEIRYHQFCQFVFYRQWAELKSYANRHGVNIIGDIPIYVSSNSVELWASPELFQLQDGAPRAVAGVPGDSFTEEGQLWGNPLYDWPRHQADGFRWWRRRIAHCARLYDGVRIDHFRGFHSYWAAPSDAKTALSGHWERGPGTALTDALRREAPSLELIAEDLGALDSDARAFVESSGVPGMKVLVFAFDTDPHNDYLPHNCGENSVLYTTTHDTPTFIQWFGELSDPARRDFAARYLRLSESEGFNWGAIKCAMATASRLCIVSMQDVLGLGGDSRMNLPATASLKNWTWRVREAALNPEVAGLLRTVTGLYGR